MCEAVPGHLWSAGCRAEAVRGQAPSGSGGSSPCPSCVAGSEASEPSSAEAGQAGRGLEAWALPPGRDPAALSRAWCQGM